MALDDSFPAITRVTKRFQVLQSVGGVRPATWNTALDRTGEDENEPVETMLMRTLARELDEDLALIRADVNQIHADVLAEAAHVVDSVEKLTADFARGHLFDQTSEKKHKQVIATSEQVHSRGSITISRRRQSRPSKIHHVLLPHRAHRTSQVTPVRASAVIQNGLEKKEKKTQNGGSRATRLAVKALSASLLQRAVRHFLYSRLYTRGDLNQLRAANTMSRRCRMRRWWRRWRSFVVQRRRLRRRLQRRQETSKVDLVERCVARAERVVETDGKFAQAKEYHRLRLIGEVLLTWMDVTTRRDSTHSDEDAEIC